MGVRPELLAYSPGQLEEASLAIVGNMRYYPNVDAATYFTREVLPLVQSRVPNVKFYVIGASPARAVRALAKLKNVIVTGYLDDPWQIVARAEVVVAPVRLGAGMQNKVLEAMALGKPVVGTTLSLQGIAGGQDGEHFIVADSPERMAEKIVDLLRHRDPARELGKRARALVEEMYTWERIGELLYDHLERWKSGAGDGRP
jgi:glycosyltransferase involved in cell wall biosynthesis